MSEKHEIDLQVCDSDPFSIFFPPNLFPMAPCKLQKLYVEETIFILFFLEFDICKRV